MTTRLTQEQTSTILSDLQAGMTYREAMSKHGVSIKTCSRIANDAGLVRPRGLPGFAVTAGQHFGHLKVVKPDIRVDGSKHRHAECLCDCGTVTAVPLHRLKRGAKCCGKRCPLFYDTDERERRAEQMRTLNARPGSKEAKARHLAGLRETDDWKASKSLMMQQRWEDPEWRSVLIRQVHGMSNHPLYQIWCGMMARCYNENDRAFKYYGALGVKVYESWHDPRVFIADIEAEIGKRPDDGRRMSNGRPWYSIDRVNVFGNYEPGNVRWADPKTQRANQRKPVT